MNSKAYKWELVGLLWVAFFLNQADRQIFNVVLSLIKTDLQFTDAQLGLISSVLFWIYGLLVPVAGFLGDMVQRKKIIVYSLIFWSFATLLTGLGNSLFYFILIRGIATGGGEAFYAPTANALISEHHDKSRSFALSLHQTAVYAGIILSGFLAGYVGEHYGWRAAFYLFGGFGLVIGVIIQFRLRSSPVLSGSVNWQEYKSILAGTLRYLSKKPTTLLHSLAFACMVFVNVGYLTWMPTFLIENFGLSLSEAGFSSMFYHHAAAFFGVLAGGRMADKLASIKPSYRVWLQAGAMLCAAPFIYGMGAGTDIRMIYLSLALFGFFRGIYDSNIFASLFEVVAPRYRASAGGLMLMFAFLMGASAPYILGVLKPSLGLAAGISGLSVAYLIAALLLIWAAILYFDKDQFIHDKTDSL